ncbi:MAG: DUF4279 domain-containing protein [Sphingobacteriales bacterium]|nr:MAG: DUF4279 domain-containing protein [Sphingobacteriales bacterium]
MTREAAVSQKAIEEIEYRHFSATEQFLQVHSLVYANGKPSIQRVEINNDELATVYFNVEDEKFFWVVYVNLQPEISVRWVGTIDYNSVRFSAYSEQLSFDELRKLTKLVPSGGWNKGDKKGQSPNYIRKESYIYFEPNPEPDEFKDKLTLLLTYLEQDSDGVRKLAEEGGHIQVYTEFHNGNSMLGGYYLEKSHIKRLAQLDLEIGFDVNANGNLFI